MVIPKEKHIPEHRISFEIRKRGIIGEGKKESKMPYSDWADKLEAIESYLRTLFPKCLIEKIEDPLRCQLFRKHIYRIEDPIRGIDHFFSLDYDYFHQNTPDEIIDLFEKRNVNNILEAPGRKEVIMTDDGIRVVPRKKM